MTDTLPTVGGDNNTWGTELNTYLTNKHAGVFNVLTYGAVGDNLTDNRVALQACMTAANAWAATYGSATFYVPDGVYLINTPQYSYNILQPVSGVRMVGSGLLKSSGNHGNQVIVQIGAYTGVVIDGIRFDGQDALDNLSIRLDASIDTTVRNCTFDNVGTSGVYIAGASTDTNLGPNNMFRGKFYQVLWHDASTALRTNIFDNKFIGGAETAEGIEINTPTGLAEDTNIVGNVFSGFLGVGASTVGIVAVAHARGVNVVGNTFSDSSIVGVRMEDGANHVNVVGNNFSDFTTYSAVYAVLGSNAQHSFNIEGNTFTRCAGNSSSANNGNTVFFEPGGVFNPWQNCSISGNLFYDNGNTSVTVQAIRIPGYLSNSRICGNIIRSQRGTSSGKGNAMIISGDQSTGPVDISGNTITDCANGIILQGTWTGGGQAILRNNVCTGMIGVGISNQATGTPAITMDNNTGAVTVGQPVHWTDTQKYAEVTFTETAAAGTYTGTVVIPIGGAITHVSYETTAVWDATTTLLDLGYTGSLTAFGSAINVDGTTAVTVLPAAAVPPTLHASGTTFTAKLVTTGSGGTTGRTRVFVGYSTPPAVAATKV